MSAEILIVDDEADIRDLVAGILEDEGFTARTARNSDDALVQLSCSESIQPGARTASMMSTSPESRASVRAVVSAM